MLLEVIATSVEEAVEAEQGGADRLELLRSLDQGGLTPSLTLIEKVTAAVSIPVRVMLRENASMSIAGPSELNRLAGLARRLCELPVDGFVLGFLRSSTLDTGTLNEILRAAPDAHVTFHRAFDALPDPGSAIEQLKQTRQVDRILTSGGDGTFSERVERVAQCQVAAAPEITMLFAAGIDLAGLALLGQFPRLREIHVGRAVRSPETNFGTVTRSRVAALKAALNALKPLPASPC